MDKNEVTIDNKTYIPRCGVVSYPRSGNSFFRNCFEKITGKLTGEDNGPQKEIDEIQEKYNVKENSETDINFDKFDYLTKNDYCLVKTHFPWWVYDDRNFIMNAAVFLVRNPFDVIESHFNLHVTLAHHVNLQEWVYQDYKEDFDNYVVICSKTYNEFHTYWIDKVKIPVIMARYEDLMINQEEELLKIYSFLMELKDSKTFMNYTDEKELKEE